MTQINKGYCQLPPKSFIYPPSHQPCAPTRVTTVSCGIRFLAFLDSFNTPTGTAKFYTLISFAFSILYYIHGNM